VRPVLEEPARRILGGWPLSHAGPHAGSAKVHVLAYDACMAKKSVGSSDRAPRSREPLQPRSRRTRERILKVAWKLVDLHGFEATSMAEVAREAGIGTGTLYHHYPDKRALLLDLIDEWGAQLAQARIEDLQAEVSLEEDPRGALSYILHSVHERLQNEDHWLWPVIFHMLGRDEGVRRRYANLQRAGAERLTALIEVAQRRGVLRRKPDPATAAYLLLNAIELLTAHVLVVKSPFVSHAGVLEELTDMICRYLVEDDPPDLPQER